MAKVSLRGRVQTQYSQAILDALFGQIENALNSLADGRLAGRGINASVVPSTGDYAQADLVWNSAPSVTGSVMPSLGANLVLLGWENTSSGSPGTMTPVYGLTGTGAGVSVVPGVQTGMMAPWPGPSSTVPSGYLLCYGQTVSRTTYASLFSALNPSSTVTITIASPGVVTWASNSLQNNDPIILRTSGAIPTGLTAGTTYYVVNNGTDGAGKFRLSATPGGSAINTSGTQSGTHTAYNSPWGDGDGSTTFTIPDLRGRSPFGRDAMGGTAANRITSGGAGINGDTLGATGGAETVTLTTSTMPSHDGHVDSQAVNGQGGGSANGIVSWSNRGGGAAHNNMPPSAIVNWIIRT